MPTDKLFHVISRGPSLKDGTRLSIGAVARGSDIVDIDQCLAQGLIVAEVDHNPHPDATPQAVRNQQIMLINAKIDKMVDELQQLEADAAKWGSSRVSVLREGISA